MYHASKNLIVPSFFPTIASHCDCGRYACGTVLANLLLHQPEQKKKPHPTPKTSSPQTNISSFRILRRGLCDTGHTDRDHPSFTLSPALFFFRNFTVAALLLASNRSYFRGSTLASPLGSGQIGKLRGRRRLALYMLPMYDVVRMASVSEATLPLWKNVAAFGNSTSALPYAKSRIPFLAIFIINKICSRDGIAL